MARILTCKKCGEQEMEYAKTGVTTMKEKTLQKIFEYYKKKYKLDTRIKFDIDGQHWVYNYIIDFIYLGYKALGRGTLYKRLGIQGKKYLYTLALLHEIKHAIDKDILTNELKSCDWTQYHTKSDYHDTRAWEIRADNFAKTEYKKWC